jgi:hypothetical protein
MLVEKIKNKTAPRRPEVRNRVRQPHGPDNSGVEQPCAETAESIASASEMRQLGRADGRRVPKKNAKIKNASSCLRLAPAPAAV